MKRWVKGLVVGIVQVGMVGSLGAKLVYDRATRPRVWALTAAYDPDLPIRGRYVSLRLVAEPRGPRLTEELRDMGTAEFGTLRVEEDKLVIELQPVQSGQSPSGLKIMIRRQADGEGVVLQDPVAFFSPSTLQILRIEKQASNCGPRSRSRRRARPARFVWA